MTQNDHRGSTSHDNAENGPAGAADKKPRGAAFDPAAVAARFDNDMSLLREVVELFSHQAQRLLPEIRAASQRRDARGLEQAAHKLKGSVANFGAREVYETALQLEMMGHSGDAAIAGDMCSRLEKELADLQQSLATYLEERATCES